MNGEGGGKKEEDLEKEGATRTEYGLGDDGFKHLSEFFALTTYGKRELSEFLSAFYLCAKANSHSPSFS